ncbi:putative Co/Zn/Cd cation transporter [metagenome]
MAGSSKKAIYAALFGNLGIAITKFIAAISTGSVSMWAESYHSVSDTVNQLLLLFGIKRSKRAYSFSHQFGHSREQFFWSFIVASLIFGISGTLSLENGISAILHGGHNLENATINFIVLIIAAGFEGYALRIALKQLRMVIKERGEEPTFKAMIAEFKDSKDPALLTVITEDTAALSGIGVAALGIFLSMVTGNPIYDAIGSIVIGAILMVLALFLAKENKDLLIGESMSKREYKKIVGVIRDIEEINRVVTLKTMHLGPEDVLIGVQVNLIDGLDTDKIELVTDKVEKAIMEIIPNLNRQHIFVEIER